MSLTTDSPARIDLDSVFRALPVAAVATDLDGRVAAATDAAAAAFGTGSPEGMRYDLLPLPPGARRPEMARPRLLEIRAAEGVWPVRDDAGRIVGAVQILEAPAPDARQLCAAMAHEIRSPLAGIRGFADLLQGDLQQNDSRRELVAKIISGVQAVNDTIAGMLDFCKPRPLALARVALPGLVRSAVDLSGCPARVGAEIDPRCRAILCDPLQVRQALINLIRNAAEAAPSGSPIAIAVRPAPRPGAVCIAVADSGSGIDAAARERLFSPFFTTKPDGTGIGLAIVKRIVERHDGEIAVESEPGRGTTVTLTLPGLEAAAPPGVTESFAPGETTAHRP